MTALDSIHSHRAPVLLALALLCTGVVLGGSGAIILDGNASTLWIAAAGAAVLCSAALAGQLWRIVSGMQRRAAAAGLALRRSEASLRTLADTVPLGIVDIDEEERVTYANAAWRRLTDDGHAPSAPAWLPGLHPDDVTPLCLAWEDARSTGHTLSQRVRMTAAGGGIRWVDVRVVPLLDRSGRLRRAIGCLVDTTRVVDAESELCRSRDDAVSASDIKSAFLARVGHELRTPLNGVLGTAELLLSDDLGREQRRRAQVLVNSGRYLLQLLDELLDFSKIEAGMVTIDSLPFDVAALVGEVAELYEGPARRRGLVFEVEIDERVPQRVAGDPTRVRQVLTNLLNNALKFTEQGRVSLVVDTVDGSTEHELRFSVHDTGVGVAASQHDQIFEAFAQADSSTTRRYGGTGLGLAICAQIAVLIGGRIGIDSEEGRGSTFWFTAPLRPESPPPTVEPGVDVATGDVAGDRPGRGDGRRVLLVEDDEVNQLVAAGLLESLGYAVDVAVDGRAAVRALARRHVYDLVLMDVQMPQMDGYEATRTVRGSGGQGATVPIIAMSAATEPEERRRCADAGMDDFVAKPVTRQDLEQKVAAQLARRPEPAAA